MRQRLQRLLLVLLTPALRPQLPWPLAVVPQPQQRSPQRLPQPPWLLLLLQWQQLLLQRRQPTPQHAMPSHASLALLFPTLRGALPLRPPGEGVPASAWRCSWFPLQKMLLFPIYQLL